MARRFFHVSLSLLALAGMFGSAEARTWHVVPDGSGDAPTIQAGIDSAASGDVLELADGVFFGVGNRDIDLGGKNVVLRSAAGAAEACVIDCSAGALNKHRGLYLHTGEGRDCRIEGITIVNGWMDADGGGIRCDGSSPTIVDCIFENHRTYGYGGALYCGGGASPLILRCVFRNNRGDFGGGGIWCGTGVVEIRECVFEWNQARSGGGVGFGQCDAMVSDCVFLGNTSFVDGGGVWVGNSRVEISQSVFAADSAGEDGGGLHASGEETDASLFACTFYGNGALGIGGGLSAAQYAEVHADYCLVGFSATGAGIACSPSGAVILGCCDVFGNVGGDWVDCIGDQEGVSGNFSADPLLCGPDLGDFTLRSDSPCLPGQHPEDYDCDLIGAFGQGCSAPTAVERTSWSGVKALFR